MTLRSVYERRLRGELSKFILRISGVQLGKSVVFYGAPIVDLAPGASLAIGNAVVLCSSTHFTALGLDHPVVMKVLTSTGRIEIGDRTGISGGSLCAAELIRIGSDCLIGANCLIVDTDFHPLDPLNRRRSPLTETPSRPTVIGDNVFVGARTIVLKGSRIGSGSVIGAGSVVAGEVPARVVAAGSPCRVLRAI